MDLLSWPAPTSASIGLMNTNSILPTSFPEIQRDDLDLFKSPRLCGYIGGGFHKPMKCQSRSICVYQESAVACCARRAVSKCQNLFTSCIGSDSICQGDDCPFDLKVLTCDEPNFPFCATYQFSRGHSLLSCAAKPTVFYSVEYAGDRVLSNMTTSHGWPSKMTVTSPTSEDQSLPTFMLSTFNSAVNNELAEKLQAGNLANYTVNANIDPKAFEPSIWKTVQKVLLCLIASLKGTKQGNEFLGAIASGFNASEPRASQNPVLLPPVVPLLNPSKGSQNRFQNTKSSVWKYVISTKVIPPFDNSSSKLDYGRSGTATFSPNSLEFDVGTASSSANLNSPEALESQSRAIYSTEASIVGDPEENVTGTFSSSSPIDTAVSAIESIDQEVVTTVGHHRVNISTHRKLKISYEDWWIPGDFDDSGAKGIVHAPSNLRDPGTYRDETEDENASS